MYGRTIAIELDTTDAAKAEAETVSGVRLKSHKAAGKNSRQHQQAPKRNSYDSETAESVTCAVKQLFTINS